MEEVTECGFVACVYLNSDSGNLQPDLCQTVILNMLEDNTSTLHYQINKLCFFIS